MSKRELHLILVGRSPKSHWQAAFQHYLERLRPWQNLKLTLIKDVTLPPAQRKIQEGKAILANLAPKDLPICLDEHGPAMTSRQFSQFLTRLSSDGNLRPCLIIGGPYGLDQAVLDKARSLLSFGPMTLPHDLAAVLLLEQLYRAESILRGLPYHHD